MCMSSPRFKDGGVFLSPCFTFERLFSPPARGTRDKDYGTCLGKMWWLYSQVVTRWEIPQRTDTTTHRCQTVGIVWHDSGTGMIGPLVLRRTELAIAMALNRIADLSQA
jgi:hypothetical protein